MVPRYSAENFPKNLIVTDKIKAIADKYGATPSQVTLAWILAEHYDCESCRCAQNESREVLLTLLPFSGQLYRFRGVVLRNVSKRMQALLSSFCLQKM